MNSSSSFQSPYDSVGYHGRSKVFLTDFSAAAETQHNDSFEYTSKRGDDKAQHGEETLKNGSHFKMIAQDVQF